MNFANWTEIVKTSDDSLDSDDTIKTSVQNITDLELADISDKQICVIINFICHLHINSIL